MACCSEIRKTQHRKYCSPGVGIIITYMYVAGTYVDNYAHVTYSIISGSPLIIARCLNLPFFSRINCSAYLQQNGINFTCGSIWTISDPLAMLCWIKYKILRCSTGAECVVLLVPENFQVPVALKIIHPCIVHGTYPNRFVLGLTWQFGGGIASAYLQQQ